MFASIGGCNPASKMRIQRLRYLLILVLALFTLNGVAGVARACALNQAAQPHTVNHSSAAGGDSHPCPDNLGSQSCFAHGVQDTKSADQKATSDLPPLVTAPPFRIIRISVPPERAVRRVILARPDFGPSLTILFGNLRI
ncbi:MAG: hypothetical protein ACM3PU_10465 [Gemmatimonadota bacterium]